MIAQSRTPIIGVTACYASCEGEEAIHKAGAKYVDSVVDGASGTPLVIPALGPRLDMDELLDRLDGLLITGSPSNLEPHHYGGPEPPKNNPIDPRRDATSLPLLRKAIEQGVPVFAICRGLQELNVALGGTLHQEVHKLKDRFDHRSDKTKAHAERYEPVHPVTVVPGGMLAALIANDSSFMINSLHGQAIDRLAAPLVAEAFAEDGTIEAVSMKGAPGFVLGVQWHPEWRVLDNPISRRLFAAFGDACRTRLYSRILHGRDGKLASSA